MSGGVYLGYCTGGDPTFEFMLSIDRLKDYSRARGIDYRGEIHSINGPRIASGRNRLVRAFLGTDAEWLLMVDDDMTFHHDVVERFLEVAHPERAPFVAGLCFGRGAEGLFPTLYHWNGKVFVRSEGWEDNVLMPVDGTGAACMFLHRSLFTELAKHFKEPWPWFEEATLPGTTQEVGEDIAFCMRVRSLDKPIFVHTGIKFGHIKKFNIDEKFYMNWCRSHRLLVTGSGRCGTGYMSKVLQRGMIPADHERFFNPWYTEFPEWGRADVSWLAAPFLERYPDAHVVHLVRDPLDTINSLMGIHMFTDEDRGEDQAWTDFVLEHCPEVFDHETMLERSMAFYVLWNRKVEPHADQRIRVEDQVTPENLLPMFRAAGSNADTMHLEAAIEGVPANVNSRQRDELTWDDLQGEWREPLLRMARSYGYKTP